MMPTSPVIFELVKVVFWGKFRAGAPATVITRRLAGARALRHTYRGRFLPRLRKFGRLSRAISR